MKPKAFSKISRGTPNIFGVNSRTFPIFSAIGLPVCWRDGGLDLAEALYISFADLAIERGSRRILTVLCGKPTTRVWRTLELVGLAANKGIGVNAVLLAPDADAENFAQNFMACGGTSMTVESRSDLTRVLNTALCWSGHWRCIVDCSKAATASLGAGNKANLITEFVSELFRSADPLVPGAGREALGVWGDAAPNKLRPVNANALTDNRAPHVDSEIPGVIRPKQFSAKSS